MARNRKKPVKISMPVSSYAAAAGLSAQSAAARGTNKVRGAGAASDTVRQKTMTLPVFGTKKAAPATIAQPVSSYAAAGLSAKSAAARGTNKARGTGTGAAGAAPASARQKTIGQPASSYAAAAGISAQSAAARGTSKARGAGAAPAAMGAGGVPMNVLKELGSNSLAWHKTTDPARRRELENKNTAIRTTNGLLFDPVGGRTFDKTGMVNLSAPMDIAFGSAESRTLGKNTMRAVMPKNKSVLLPQSPTEGVGELLRFEAQQAQEKEMLKTQYQELKELRKSAYGADRKNRAQINDQMRAIEKRYDTVTGTNGFLRFVSAANSIDKAVKGAGLAMAETLHQRGINEAENVKNPQLVALREQAAALDLELQNYLQSGAGMYEISPQMRAKQQELAELRNKIDAMEDKTEVDPNKLGQRMMKDALYAAQFATDMPDKGKQFLANTGLSIAQNVAMLPLAAIHPALPLAAMGTVAAAQKTVELNAQGEEPGAAMLRGIVSGGVEALTEKMPLDNVLDLIKTGGKGALRNLLKQAGVEATEEGLSYAANYVSDLAAHDQNAAFSIKELGSQMLAGGLSGLVMGGAGTAIGHMGKKGGVHQDARAAAAQGTLAQTDAQRAQDAPNAAPVPVQDGGEAATVPVQDGGEAATVPVQDGGEAAPVPVQDVPKAAPVPVRMRMTFGHAAAGTVASESAAGTVENVAAADTGKEAVLKRIRDEMKAKRRALRRVRVENGVLRRVEKFTPPDKIQTGDYVRADDRGNYGVVVKRTPDGDFVVRFINQETHATATVELPQDRVQRVMEVDEYKTASPEEIANAQNESLGYNEERMNALLRTVEQRWDNVQVPYSAVPVLREQMAEAANNAVRASKNNQPSSAENNATLTALEGETTREWARFASDIYNANQAQRIFLKIIARKWNLSEADLIDAREISAGREPARNVLQINTEQWDRIQSYAGALYSYNEGMTEAFFMQDKIRAQRIQNVVSAISQSDEWQDSHPLRNAVSTPERVIRHVCGDDADSIIDKFITPVHRHEAESVLWQKNMRDLLRKITKNTTKEESVLVHMKNRLRENPDNSELQVACAEYEKNHAANIDSEHVEDMEKQLIALTAQMFPDISQAQILNGMEPLEFRSHYIPSLPTINEGNAIQKILRKLGIETNADELPTEIAGKTEDFRPGKKYAQFRNSRTGLNTEFDAVKAVDDYITNAAHAIYHTGDIQNLRTLEEQLRMKTVDEATKSEYLLAKKNTTMGMGDKTQAISKFFEKDIGNLPHFPTWIGEYTNLLAGKKAKADRVIEDFVTGRGIYRTVNDIESKVAANMVGLNMNSALTNIIPLTQGGAELRKRSMIRSIVAYTSDMLSGKDGYDYSSDFLTNRKGAGRVSETTLDKIKNAAFLPMSAVDSFSSGVLHRARVMDNMETRNMGRAEAVAEADSWCAGVMADRSLGAMPIAFSVKNPLVRLFSMFQLEVANQYGYMLEDIPHNQREKGVAAIAGVLFQIALGAFLYNDAKEEITGSRSATDPLDILNNFMGDLSGYQLPNTFDALGQLMQGELGADDFKTEKTAVHSAIQSAGEEIVGELPFVGGVMGGGRIPISAALPNFGTLVDAATNSEKSFGKRVQMAGKELAKPLFYLLPPTGGGQLKKSVEGIATVLGGGSFTKNADGRDELQFPAFGQSPADYLRAATFGKYASSEAQDYIDSGFRKLGAEATAAYKSMQKDYGVDGETAYEAIRAIADAKPQKDADGKPVQTTREVQQELLFAMEGMNADQKRILDWKLISHNPETMPARYEDRDSFLISVYVPEKVQNAAREARNAGAAVTDFISHYDAMCAAKKQPYVKGSDAREQALQQLMDDKSLADGEKNVLAQCIFINDLSDRRQTDWKNTYKGALLPAQFVQIADKYSEISEQYEYYNPVKGETSAAQMSATDFSKYVDSLGLSPVVGAALKGDFSYYHMNPADSIPYKWDMLASKDEKKVAGALEASGLNIDTYTNAKRVCGKFEADKDADGKSINGTAKKKVVNYVRALANVTRKQQDLMLQAMGYKID